MMNLQRSLIHTDKFPTLAYFKAGKGPAMVLLHGFPENAELWHKVITRLSGSFTVIAPDMPGVGESTFVEDISMEDMAESVHLILQKENIAKAVIAGHSMGGYVALAFAELYPDTVAGLSLVHSSAAADNEEKKETRRKAIELIKKGGKDGFIKQMIPGLFASSYKEANPEVIREYIERGLQVPAEVLIAFYTAMINRPDRVRILEEAKFPVQFIMGKDDGVIPPEKVIGQSKQADINFISLYEDCGHMSMLEMPEALAKDLREFGDYCHANNK